MQLSKNPAPASATSQVHESVFLSRVGVFEILTYH
jgi:hypothetical protein